MRIIVHAGMNKTGSSAVQEYLGLVRRDMPATGYIYPGEDEPSHWKLAVALTGERSLKKDEKPRGYLDRRAQKHKVEPGAEKATVAAAITGAGPDDAVILSHENFSTPPRAAALMHFLREVAPHAEVHAIAYIRHPVSAYPSVVQQVIKGRMAVVPPSKWVWSHPKRAAGLHSAFGANTLIRVHDRALLRDGDVVEDFRALTEDLTGRPLPPAPKALSTNTSISGAGCTLLYQFWQAHPAAGGEQSRLRKELERFSAGRRDPKLRLPDGWERTIAAKNHALWNEAVAAVAMEDDVRRRLLLQHSGDVPAARVGNRDVEAWLASYLNADFIAGFLDHLRSRGERKPLREETRQWIESLARSSAPQA